MSSPGYANEPIDDDILVAITHTIEYIKNVLKMMDEISNKGIVDMVEKMYYFNRNYDIEKNSQIKNNRIIGYYLLSVSDRYKSIINNLIDNHILDTNNDDSKAVRNNNRRISNEITYYHLNDYEFQMYNVLKDIVRDQLSDINQANNQHASTTPYPNNHQFIRKIKNRFVPSVSDLSTLYGVWPLINEVNSEEDKHGVNHDHNIPFSRLQDYRKSILDELDKYLLFKKSDPGFYPIVEKRNIYNKHLISRIKRIRDRPEIPVLMLPYHKRQKMCSNVCSSCERTISIRWSALCRKQCNFSGIWFQACLVAYHAVAEANKELS